MPTELEATIAVENWGGYRERPSRTPPCEQRRQLTSGTRLTGDHRYMIQCDRDCISACIHDRQIDRCSSYCAPAHATRSIFCCFMYRLTRSTCKMLMSASTFRGIRVPASKVRALSRAELAWCRGSTNTSPTCWGHPSNRAPKIYPCIM